MRGSMRMITKSRSTSIYKHLSVITACAIIISLSLNIQNTPSVEASLQGPYDIVGYIDMNNDSDIPSGKTVTLTNLNNSRSDTTTTGAQGSFSKNVGKDSIIDSDDGNWIVVNCSYDGEVGENVTIIYAGSGSYSWCNLTGGTRLESQSLSINVSPWDWDAGTINYGSYNSTSNTYFNLTNQGNVKINIKIHGENITWNGHKWNLTSTTALDNYTLEYQKNGEGGWTDIGITNASFVTNLQYNSDYFSYTYWQQFGLNVSMPTMVSSDPSENLSTSVRFWSEIA